MKTRAITVLSAGGLICLVTGVLFIALGWVSGSHVISSVSQATGAEFYGKSLAGIAALFVCGLFALANGTIMLKRGKPNQLLSFAMIGGMLMGIEMIREAASLIT